MISLVCHSCTPIATCCQWCEKVAHKHQWQCLLKCCSGFQYCSSQNHFTFLHRAKIILHLGLKLSKRLKWGQVLHQIHCPYSLHVFGVQSSYFLTAEFRVFLVDMSKQDRFNQEFNLLNSADFNLILQFAMVLFKGIRKNCLILMAKCGLRCLVLAT